MSGHPEMTRHQDGPPHPHGVLFPLICLTLAVGAVVAMAGKFDLSDPVRLLFFVPVAFAGIGYYYASWCDGLWSSMEGKRTYDRAIRVEATRIHHLAGNWSSAAWFFSIPAFFAVLDGVLGAMK